ncbi:MAG: hypothetical protein K6G40_02765 [Eubacterium sp.]|nr:hypothetical protein [Eubacterium sp.]
MRKLKLVLMGLLCLALAGCGNSSMVEDIAEENTEVQGSEDDTEDESEVDVDISEEDIEEEEGDHDDTSSEEGIDVDLTAMSSTMVYSEVYNMVTVPDDYIGKTVKMCGLFSVYEDEQSGKIYYACVIQDATQCCAQGIEFVLEGDYSYPEDYPEIGAEITVTGMFETYEEDGYLYCELVNANMQ